MHVSGDQRILEDSMHIALGRPGHQMNEGRPVTKLLNEG